MLVGNLWIRWLLLLLLPQLKASRLSQRGSSPISGGCLVRSAVLKDKLELLERRYLRRSGEQP